MSIRVGKFEVLDPPEPIPDRSHDPRAVVRAADRFKLLGNPNRLGMLMLLVRGPLTPAELTARLGLTAWGLVQVAGKMRAAGAIESVRGPGMIHRLTDHGRRLAGIATTLIEED